MATVMYFRLLFGCRCRSLGKNFHGLLPSVWNSSASARFVLERNVCALSLTRCDREKSDKYDRDRRFYRRVRYGYVGLAGLVYSVVRGCSHAECVGKETGCESEEKLAGTRPKTPPVNIDSAEVRDTSGRFSSCHKIEKKHQKIARAVSLLKGNAVKRKLQFDGDERRENEGQPKRTTRSVSVRYLFCLLFNL